MATCKWCKFCKIKRQEECWHPITRLATAARQPASRIRLSATLGRLTLQACAGQAERLVCMYQTLLIIALDCSWSTLSLLEHMTLNAEAQLQACSEVSPHVCTGHVSTFMIGLHSNVEDTARTGWGKAALCNHMLDLVSGMRHPAVRGNRCHWKRPDKAHRFQRSRQSAPKYVPYVLELAPDTCACACGNIL